MSDSSLVILALIILGCSGCAPDSQTEPGTQRLSWGDPDLRGVWDYRTATPLTTPQALGTRVSFDDAEKSEFENGSEARGVAFVRSVGNYVGDEPWADRGLLLTEGSRAALVFDPPDGKLPPRTRYGKKLKGQFFAQLSSEETVDPEDRTVLERCIVAPLVPLRPLNFNNNIKIIQSPGYVVIVTEMIHDARIVPIRRSSSKIEKTGVRRWFGESVGYWENETLVVETTSFRAYPNLLGTSPDLHLTERFTANGTSQLTYEYRVDDPSVFTQPWSARQTLQRLEGRMYEYACHEANVSMTLMLRGSRTAESDGAQE